MAQADRLAGLVLPGKLAVPVVAGDTRQGAAWPEPEHNSQVQDSQAFRSWDRNACW
ncbi:MAG: hypothetical protein M3Y81_26540 [Chloroflexota bacterium]|nr:hypothetical protein [Chloroflexota bacterium]